MNPITIRAEGDAYRIDGKRYDPRSDHRAWLVTLLAIARAPHPVSPAEARYALGLSMFDLPVFQRVWKGRLRDRLADVHPVFADELEARLTVGWGQISFDQVLGLDRPVVVDANLLSVTSRALPRFRDTVLSTDHNATEDTRMRVLLTNGAALLDGKLFEGGDVIADPDPKFVDAMRDCLVPLREPTSAAEVESQELLGALLKVHATSWGGNHVGG